VWQDSDVDPLTIVSGCATTGGVFTLGGRNGRLDQAGSAVAACTVASLPMWCVRRLAVVDSSATPSDDRALELRGDPYYLWQAWDQAGGNLGGVGADPEGSTSGGGCISPVH